MNPPSRRELPATAAAWLEEIRAAYEDARETIPFGPTVGREFGEQELFHLAPAVALKFRGLPMGDARLKRATEAALTSYVAIEEGQSAALSDPRLAFAFCYLASHFALGLVEAATVEMVMEYLEQNTGLLSDASRMKSDPSVNLPGRRGRRRSEARSASTVTERRRKDEGPTEGRVPVELRPLHDEIVSIASKVAVELLDAEFAGLVTPLTSALARKRPSPLRSGRAATWAAGVLSVIARTNFLFDKTRTPYCAPDQLAKACGVSYSASAAKARTIEHLLGIVPMDPRWTPPSRLRDNPLAWLIEFDGVVLDARMLPREVQEKMVAAGLIPFVP